MADEMGIFSDKEVAKLDAKSRKALRAEARRQLRTPEIQKLINKDPVGKIIHPHENVRRKLRAKLRPTLDEMKQAAKGK